MRPLAKVGLVAAGYAAAFGLASAVVAVYVAATSTLDRQTYAGMYAFGDSLVFLGVFGVAALVPTGVACFFLRPYPAFWRLISIAAVAMAAIAAAALAAYLVGQGAPATSSMSAWGAVAVLRILVAPMFALVFLVAGVIAPRRGPRFALLGAGAVEAAAFVRVAAAWFQALRSP